MAFSYAGSHPANEFFVEMVEKRCNELRKTIPDFKDFEFKFWCAENLLETFKQVENQFEIEIRFKNNLPLDDISGVDQAYIGYIDAPELMKLIVDPNGSIRRNVFFDNVRDFQGGDNSVNKEIANAVRNDASTDKFVLYNNGVTAVASFMKNLGSNRFLLRNYQIVNGCQTSNVLYLNRTSNSFEKILVPIKIVHTKNPDVVSKVIRANNRQTPVPNEAFLALEAWHKSLQEHISIESKRIGETIFYERRSREYTLLDRTPEKKRIIGLHGMIRAYTAAFLQRPHMVIANNPTEILRSRGDQIFEKNHKFGPYLVAAMLIYKIQEHINKSEGNSFLQKYKYHAAMLLVVGIHKSTDLPDPKSKQANKLSDAVLTFCINQEKFSGALKIAIEFIKESHDKYIKTRESNSRNPPSRSGDFSEYLLREFSNS
ncbi:AIPR family protein [Chitiniphilus eburneus]|uniref:AIPR family protein n=1 Tax=Chitiniphilus eburneus TaxID=2571148 RepID=UPI0035CFBF4A